jgi:uncharacterized alpha/beta hydrolase family protein
MKELFQILFLAACAILIVSSLFNIWISWKRFKDSQKTVIPVIHDHTPKGYINAAIAMLKDMVKDGNIPTAGYNGVVSLLTEAKELLDKKN